MDKIEKRKTIIGLIFAIVAIVALVGAIFIVMGGFKNVMSNYMDRLFLQMVALGIDMFLFVVFSIGSIASLKQCVKPTMAKIFSGLTILAVVVVVATTTAVYTIAPKAFNEKYATFDYAYTSIRENPNGVCFKAVQLVDYKPIVRNEGRDDMCNFELLDAIKELGATQHTDPSQQGGLSDRFINVYPNMNDSHKSHCSMTVKQNGLLFVYHYEYKSNYHFTSYKCYSYDSSKFETLWNIAITNNY